MVYIYDRLSEQFLYVNQNHIIHTSEWIGTKIYIHLTNGKKLLIDRDDFNRILKECEEENGL